MKKEWLIPSIGGGWKEFEYICGKLSLEFEVTELDKFVHTVAMTVKDYWRYEGQMRLIKAKRELYSQLLRTEPPDLTSHEQELLASVATDSDIEELCF